MRIINLTKNSRMYTSNAYLVLGAWNAIGDVNTLVDTGRDPWIIDEIMRASTGLGKRRVDQVVLTHSHYDHAGLLPLVRRTLAPTVYAFSPSLKGVDCVLRDGAILKIGDRMFEVIHTSGHSSDSICLYCEEERVLFAGDTTLLVHSPGGSYEERFVRALERISRKDVREIYFGHGEPILNGCNALIRRTLKNVRKSIGGKL